MQLIEVFALAYASREIWVHSHVGRLHRKEQPSWHQQEVEGSHLEQRNNKQEAERVSWEWLES